MINAQTAPPTSPAGRLCDALFRRGLRRDAWLGLALHGAAQALTLVTGIVLARALGPAEYGGWAAATAVAILVTSLATLGLPNVVTARSAAALGSGAPERAADLFRRSLSLATAAALVGALLLAAASRGQPAPYALPLAIAASSVPFACAAQIIGARLQGIGYGVLAQATANVARPLVMLAGVLVALAIGARADAAMAACAFAAGSVAACVGLALADRRLEARSPRGTATAEAAPPFAPALREAMPFLAISLLAIAGARIDLLILAALATPREVGLYEVAARGADLVMVPLVATAAMLGPEFARRNARDGIAQLQRLASLATIGLAALSLPALVAFLAWPDAVARLLFGAEFSAAGAPLAILAVGYYASLCMGPVHLLLGMTGHGRASATAALAALLLGSAGSLLLVPRLGMEGAAIARGASQALVAMALAVWTRRRLGIATSLLAWHRHRAALGWRAAR